MKTLDLKKILSSYKTIIYISFLINISMKKKIIVSFVNLFFIIKYIYLFLKNS